MSVVRVEQLKIYPDRSESVNGRIVKVLRENPPRIKGDPWTFIVLTEEDLK